MTEPTTDDALCDELIGLPEIEASSLAHERGYVVRVVAVGDQQFPVTMDLRSDRVNLRLSEERVVLGAQVG